MKEGFARRLEELRLEQGLTLKKIAELLGSRETVVSGWANGRHIPHAPQLLKLADLLHTSVDYLLGRSDDPVSTAAPPTTLRDAVLQSRRSVARVLEMIDLAEKIPKQSAGRTIPIVGRIPASPPETWNQEAEGFVMVPQGWVPDREDVLALKVTGDSMSPTLEPGDIVVMRKTRPREGDIVAAVVRGGTNLKRLMRIGNRLVLKPDAPHHKTEPVDEDTTIEWKAVAVLLRQPRPDL